MKKKIYIAVSVVSVLFIIAGIMLSTTLTNKDIQNNEQTARTEETEVEEKEVQALENEEEITKNWDRSKVTIEHDTAGVPVPVPIGFTASKAEEEQTVNTGFVIYEGEVEAVNPNEWTEEEAWKASLDKNQFVWVPVKNASERIYEKDETTGKIKARLWDFSSTGRKVINNANTDIKREAGVISNQGYDNIRYFSNIGKKGMGMSGYSKDTFYKELETELIKTMESIEKYGGFYIGRYETGNIGSNIPVVRRMNTDLYNQSWYQAYPKMNNISTKKNIKISMIWGCLWDETLQWLVDTGDKTYSELTDSTTWGNYFNSSTFTYKINTSGATGTKNNYFAKIIPAGSTEYTKANNIYDLAGNLWDWTLECDPNKPDSRIARGGSWNDYGYSSSVNERNNCWVPYSSNYYAFRAYLYIK